MLASSVVTDVGGRDDRRRSAVGVQVHRDLGLCTYGVLEILGGEEEGTSK
jgi:hypothetical protein